MSRGLGNLKREMGEVVWNLLLFGWLVKGVWLVRESLVRLLTENDVVDSIACFMRSQVEGAQRNGYEIRNVHKTLAISFIFQATSLSNSSRSVEPTCRKWRSQKRGSRLYGLQRVAYR